MKAAVSESTAFFRGVSNTAIVAIASVLLVGAVFGGIVLFHNYENTFARLTATDTLLDQQIYNESVARQLADTLLVQQNAELADDLAEETLIRAAEYLALLYAINNETQARIASELIIAYAIGNETASRLVVDAIFAANITSLFDLVNTTEVFQAYSNATFLQLFTNVTYLSQLLTNEIAERLGNDTQLSATTAQQNQTLAYLNTTLTEEIRNRTIFEDLLFEMLVAVNAMGFNTSATLKSINGQLPINHDMEIVSGNNVTTTVTTTPGSVVLDNKAIFTINSIAPDSSTGNVGFTAGTKVAIDTTGMPPNTWRVSYLPGASIPPNIQYTSSSGIFVSPPLIPELTWTWMFGTSTPLGAGTHLVEIHATLVMRQESGGPPGSTATMQFAMLFGSPPSCNITHPEPGGCMTLLDSVALVPATGPDTDVTFRSLLILQGGSFQFYYASRINPTHVDGMYYTITRTQVN
jgi:hypothetical protein